MKKILTALGLLLLTVPFLVPAAAGVPCTVPFNLTNGTVADATQVMANYNAILACLSTSTAHSGANSDITSLSALTTPLSPGQGGSTNWTGATSSGSANAQVVATTPTSFALAVGNSVTFVPGFSNTGPLQLNVNATGLTNALRKLPTGIAPMAGGEVLAGSTTRFVYDGTQFVQDVSSNGVIPVGVSMDFMGTSVPVGWLIEDGSCVSQTTYAGLFAYLSTLWNFAGCTAGTFQLPDMRGRQNVAIDNQGSNGAAGVNDCGGVGAYCGNEYRAIAQANLPAVNFAVTIGAGQGSHTHALTNAGSVISSINGAGSVNPAGSNSNATSIAAATLPTMTGTAASGGSGSIFSVQNPSAFGLKAIKY